MNGNEQDKYKVEFSSKFEKTLSSLPDEIQKKARDALRKFINGPRGALRVHTYKDVHPAYVVIDVMSNHSYQIAFRKKGG